ncbi:sphingomyelinase phosphodiesterase D isoform X2 [Nematostella vectensis]|nr:sphingomyelinase phosphodiesterase D isoform X2 [Nematostella vectensis]XP_048579261.1 sphingomyelinase phosphodiesterase D isoform X2 [Nematostella vectensis]
MNVHTDSTNDILGVSYDDGATRWRRKTMCARWVIAVLTLICTGLIVVLLLTFELQLNCAAKQSSYNTNLDSSIKFLMVSDLHLDSYYDASVASKPTFCRGVGNYSTANYKAPYGRVGCDSPEILIDSLVKGMRSVYDEKGADFMIITGDMSSHKTDASYLPKGKTSERVLHNIKLASAKIHNAFPKIPVFPMLGNNDFEGHYVLPNTSHDQWYNKTLEVFAPMILCSNCSTQDTAATTMAELKTTFLDGGYYKVHIADGRMILLILNSMYWNPYAVEKSYNVQVIAKRQLDWLEQQLEFAKKESKKVFIAGHIPPGIDPFGDKGTPFWMENCTARYTNMIVGKYSDIVAGQFFAHIHQDDFKLQMFNTSQHLTGSKTSFALLNPSVSVVYANNPAFRQVYLDRKELAILDYDQHFLDIVMATEFNAPNWQLDYRFSEHYPSANKYINTDRILELNQNLINQSHENAWATYVFSRAVRYQASSYSRFGLYCAMRHVIKSEYDKCRSNYKVPGG